MLVNEESVESENSVYHYTDGQGLKGILENKELWCTHYSYLNDTMEQRLRRDMYREVLVEATKQATARRAEIASQLLEYLDTLKNGQWPPLAGQPEIEDDITNIFMFTASFSAKSDDLGQWRGYSGNGARFCIGFDKAQLGALSILGLQFDRVSYDVESERRRMRMELSEKLEALEQWMMSSGYRNARQLWPPEIIQWTRHQYLIRPPLLKDPAFKEEAEYRLYGSNFGVLGMQFMSNRTVEFRVGRSYLVPFIRVSLAKLLNPITSIIVGPTPYPAEARAAVQILCRRSNWPGLSEAQVRNSIIPYRDW